MNKTTITWLIVLLLTINLVLATGIRPANTNLGEQKYYEGTFWVVNNDQRELSVKIYVAGEMSPYLTVNQDRLTFRNDDDALPVTFTLNLPDQLPPGVSTAVIVIEEELPATLPCQ